MVKSSGFMAFCADDVGAAKMKIAAAIRKEKIVFSLSVFCSEKFELTTNISLFALVRISKCYGWGK